VISDGVLTMTGSPLATPPSIRLVDFDGNLTTEISTETVLARVSSGGGDVVTDGGGNQVVFNSGVATLSNLAVVAVPGSAQFLRFETTVRGRRSDD
jgi:hypothetical protein